MAAAVTPAAVTPTAVTPTAVKSSSSVEAASTESSAMETAKTRLSPRGVGPRNPAMIEPAEGPGMGAGQSVRAGRSTKRFMPAETSAGTMSEVPLTRMKSITVDDRPAMRDVRVVVVDHSPAAVPIVIPMVPTPPEAAK